MKKKFQDQVTGLGIHLYLKKPTQYLLTHQKELLPDWNLKPKTLVIVLFQAKEQLEETSNSIEQEKNRLRAKFLQFGQRFQSEIGILTEIICPQTGKPLGSASGKQTFDMIAVVNQSLSVEFKHTPNNCKVLNYPNWKAAVYPCLLVSLASISEIEPIVSKIA